MWNKIAISWWNFDILHVFPGMWVMFRIILAPCSLEFYTLSVIHLSVNSVILELKWKACPVGSYPWIAIDLTSLHYWRWPYKLQFSLLCIIQNGDWYMLIWCALFSTAINLRNYAYNYKIFLCFIMVWYWSNLPICSGKICNGQILLALVHDWTSASEICPLHVSKAIWEINVGF